MSYIKDFGATGDGQTDDTAEIQHAVNEGDGVLRFSRGVYRITEPIVIDLGRTGYAGIRGEQGTARIVMAGEGPAFHIVGDHQGTANPASVRDETWERARMPIVSGIEIVGEHEASEGIRLQKTMQAIISNISVRRCRYGIRLVERNRNVIISDSHLYHNRAVGLYLDHVNLHQINVLGCHISYNPVAGILLRGGDVRNFQITGNDIEYNDDDPEGAADVWLDTREGTLRELTLTGNTIQAVPSPNGASVRITGSHSPAADRSGLMAIAGNLIGSQTINFELQNTRGITLTGNSIYSAAELTLLARHCRNIVFSGNSIDYNPGVQDRMKDGVRFEDCADCLVTGCVLVDCRHGDDEFGGAVALLNCQDTAILNCQILDPQVRGIDLRNCRRCRITGNTILDRRAPDMQAAIRVAGESADNLIQHNMLQPGTEGAIIPATAAREGDNTIL